MEKQGRETIPITPSLRLVPYYPAYETTLPWYQDAELCHQVDNQSRIYDLSILKNMYEYLNIHGDLFYIECEGTLCGDVCLQTSGEIAIVICKAYQNRHIGRAVVGKILELAREKGVQCTVPGNVPLNRICAEGCRNVCLSAEIRRRTTP